jgi:dTDP-4-dehydrorhamnose reductase
MADPGAVRAMVRRVAPRVIVNAAAYNEVDRAETEPEVALRVNADSVGELGEYARREGASLLTYSTDFVFDGAKGALYVEADPVNPLSAYARSKLAGETLLAELGAPSIVLRTAWVYSLRRKSFVSFMLELARKREELRIADDQVGSPTWCRDLARATVEVLDALGADPGARAAEARGVYHAAGAGACSRYELATAALALDPRRGEHVVKRVERARAADFAAPAARPLASPLDCTRLRDTFGVTLRPWKEALIDCLRP